MTWPGTGRFNTGMKPVILLLTAAGLMAATLPAQYHPAGPEVTADLDSLLEAGMDELLSYLLLTRDDFTFRDDYLEKDSFRLSIVDSLMRHPLIMNAFTDDCASRFAAWYGDPDTILTFLASILGCRYTHAGDLADVPAVSAPQGGEEAKATRTWKDSRDAIHSCLAGWNRASEKYLNDNLDPDDIVRIIDRYRDLILEDVADKDRSAEEQDSISNVEEQFAIDFARMAARLTFPEIQGIRFVLAELDNIQAHLAADERLRRKAAAKPIEKPGNKKKSRRTAIGSFGKDVYRGDYDLIIDPGGDDSYHLSCDPHNPHPTVIADFSGNDIYEAETEFALACGAFAYSLLVDYDGDDIYRGGNFSLGAGYFGVGILWDKKGNDSYFGDTFTEGAGTFGLGLLIDSEGSDTYTGNLFCQGFGFVNGIGGIIDNSGNDTYTVQPKYGDYIRYEDHYISLSQGFGYGIRPWLSGGWGFLFDYAGNDAYISDIFGQGASYWWSLGMLYDKSGNDQYLSHQYAQGNGTHMSLGILRDDAGNDIYRAYGVSQGCGHDYACGWLQDRAGDDLYATYDLGHGAGQANGFGIFTDLTGNDRYYVMLTGNTQGYGNPRRDYGSIGVFLDLDGDDRYDGNGSNNRFWTLPGSKWGGGLDRHIPVPGPADTAEAEP